MHSYNTRFRAMNRSFAASRDDEEYVPSHDVTSGGRRPITRSMTRALAPAPAPAPAAPRLARRNPDGGRPITRSMTAGQATQIAQRALSAARGYHPMMLRSDSRAAAMREASTRRSGNTHPMTLRSARR